MKSDTLERIVQLARQSDEPKVKDIDGGRRRMIFKPDGTYEIQDAQPAARDHGLRSVDALVRLAKYLQHDGKPVVWYSRSCVSLVCDDDTRHDRATLQLEYSDTFKFLHHAEAHAWYDQRPFVLMLRTKLRGTLGSTGSLLDVVRNLNFKVEENGQGVIQVGKSSVGRSVRAEVSGPNAIPEEVTLNVPVFKQVCRQSYSVGCAIDVDEVNRKFRLIVLPDQLEMAAQAAEADVGSIITDALAEAEVEVPVFFGNA